MAKIVKNFIKLLSLSGALVMPVMALEVRGDSAVSTPAPGQREINDELRLAANGGLQGITKSMLSKKPLESSKSLVSPAISADSRIHSSAAALSTVHGAATVSAPIPSHVTDEINDELMSAAKDGEQGIMEYLLSPDSLYKPDQAGINNAFIEVAGSGQQVIVEWMLSLPEGKGRPDQKGIKDAHSKAIACKEQAIVRVLEPYLAESSNKASVATAISAHSSRTHSSVAAASSSSDMSQKSVSMTKEQVIQELTKGIDSADRIPVSIYVSTRVDPKKYTEFTQTCNALLRPDMESFYRAVLIQAVSMVNASQYQAFIKTCDALLTPKLSANNRATVIKAVSCVDPAKHNKAFTDTCNALFRSDMDVYYHVSVIEALSRVDASRYQTFTDTCNASFTPNLLAKNRATVIEVVSRLPETVWPFMAQFVRKNPTFFRYIPLIALADAIGSNPLTEAELRTILSKLHQIYQKRGPHGTPKELVFGMPVISADSSRVHSLAAAKPMVPGAVAVSAPKPSNDELICAARNGQQWMMEYLLSSDSLYKPDQAGINNAFIEAAGSGQQKIVEWMLNRTEGKGRPDQKGIKDAHSNAITRGQQAIVLMLEPYLTEPSYVVSDKEKAKLKDLQSKSRMDQTTINWELWFALRDDYQEIVKWMLSPDSSLKPDQVGFNNAFANLAQAGEQKLMELMLSLGSSLKINQNGIDKAFSRASEHNQKGIMEWMISRGLIPGQDGFNNAFIQAARGGNKVIMEWMLSPDRPLRPNQTGVNIAFVSEVSVAITIDVYTRRDEFMRMNAPLGMIEVMEWMLNPDRPLIPDQGAIIEAYRDAVNRRATRIITLLEPHVPLLERQNQGRAPGGGIGVRGRTQGMAFEIHDYADAKVSTSSSSSSSSSSGTVAPKQMKLIDAVFKNIKASLQVVTLIPYPKAKGIIEQGIEKFISKDKQAEAKDAALRRLGGDSSYEQDISLVVTFMKQFYPGKMEQWIKGFIEESINAYINSTNRASCSKGIRERIATGLRGIDPELDKLFAQPEGRLLFGNWLKTWNLNNIKGEAKQNLADQLKAKGITEKSSVEEVVNSFKAIATEQLKANGLGGDKALQAEIDAYAESMIEFYYEKELKPFVDGVSSAAGSIVRSGKDEAR